MKPAGGFASERAWKGLRAELSERLGAWLGPGADSCLYARKEFNRLALRVFRLQYRANPLLASFWDYMGADPAKIDHWTAVPPVPSRAFREAPLAAGPAQAVFRTSGTTGGGRRRGEHHVVDLDLYRLAARNHYRACLLGGVEKAHLLALAPHPRKARDSSLSWMVGMISSEPEIERATWALSERDVNVDRLRSAVAQAASARRPVLLLTTAFALARLLDRLRGESELMGRDMRIMETGGFKGRVAEVSRDELYRRARSILGARRSRIVNEYGMTELLSQAYDARAGEGGPLKERVHRFPPWVRVSALDPRTLLPLPPGEAGLLAHFDLANALSVCRVLTEDVGWTTKDNGFRILRRARGSLPRGCSLDAEPFLEAANR